MSKNILPCFLLPLFLFSCKEKKKYQYYLKEKWTTKILPYATLKNEPESVVEYFYRGIENIDSNPLPQYASYESFKYNKSGDQTEYKIYSGASNNYTLTIKYKDDGYSAVMQDHSTKNFEEKLMVDFQKTANDKYQQTEWLFTLGRKQQLVMFGKDGNEIRKEEIREDSVDGKLLVSKTVFLATYDDQRPLKETWTSTTDGTVFTSSKTFFYSSEKYLDSIIYNFGSNISRTYFINNDNGDPVEETSINMGDTTEQYIRIYKYDKNGNWIRMLEKETKGNKTPDSTSPYILINRKILYFSN